MEGLTKELKRPILLTEAVARLLAAQVGSLLHFECHLSCWFLDAGNDETLGRLSWPASKKRQGTMSPDVCGSCAAGAMGILPRVRGC